MLGAIMMIAMTSAAASRPITDRIAHRFRTPANQGGDLLARIQLPAFSLNFPPAFSRLIFAACFALLLRGEARAGTQKLRFSVTPL
jgi:hypothetical protein